MFGNFRKKSVGQLEKGEWLSGKFQGRFWQMTFQFMAIYAGMFLTIRVPKAIGFRNQNDKEFQDEFGVPLFL